MNDNSRCGRIVASRFDRSSIQGDTMASMSVVGIALHTAK
jgi:hypothetical protein